MNHTKKYIIFSFFLFVSLSEAIGAAGVADAARAAGEALAVAWDDGKPTITQDIRTFRPAKPADWPRILETGKAYMATCEEAGVTPSINTTKEELDMNALWFVREHRDGCPYKACARFYVVEVAAEAGSEIVAFAFILPFVMARGIYDKPTEEEPAQLFFEVNRVVHPAHQRRGHGKFIQACFVRVVDEMRGMGLTSHGGDATFGGFWSRAYLRNRAMQALMARSPFVPFNLHIPRPGSPSTEVKYAYPPMSGSLEGDFQEKLLADIERARCTLS